ncbi:MAG: glycosyltransferase [Alphaproteobacteria bacterium]|nr:glycosyltransferase [Alphaproteobacteria bacterium]
MLAVVVGRGWPRKGRLHSLVPILAKDPLDQARLRGIALGHVRRRPSQEVRLRARRVRDQARRTERRAEALDELLAFVSNYPAIEEFQKIVARLLHEMHDERALPAWLGVSLRFPRSMDSFHNLAVVAHRYRGPEAVAMIVAARFPRMPTRIDQLLAYAEACDLAGALREKQAAFDRLAGMFEKRNDAWLVAASWLEEELGVNRSVATLLRRVAAGAGLRPAGVLGSKRLRLGRGTNHSSPNGGSGAPPASVRVLQVLFDSLLEMRQALVDNRLNVTAPVSLLTGSLGAGGAERQLVNTAIALKRMDPTQRRLENGLVLGPINVVARSLNDRNDGSFFLGDLHQASVDVRSYRELPDFGGTLAASAVRPALTALGYLPWSTAEAVIKLTDWLTATRPEVVHIWQDGLVYAAGLAALLAGVPRIVLSGRSSPPPDRRERYLVEYDVIYKSLLRAPGVKLSVNSHHAAKRYATWLGIDVALISVIPNGVARPSTVADAPTQAAFQEFDARTPSSGLTIGAVMRLDEVKRPLLWLDAAAAIAGRRCDARFVIVGDGPLRARAEKRAEALGIANRCLFAGRSARIGYWLSKMDALMLLSAHEGLPNALIEAQLSGVPVITSPAGGAPEALLPGTTGIVTSPDPTPWELADIVAGLTARPGLLKEMGLQAERWAAETFPIERMLDDTMKLYMAAGATLPSGGPSAARLGALLPEFQYVIP